MSGTVMTKSRCEMLFLTKLRGHSLFFVRRRPKLFLLGIVLYENTWVLLPTG